MTLEETIGKGNKPAQKSNNEKFCCIWKYFFQKKCPMNSTKLSKILIVEM